MKKLPISALLFLILFISTNFITNKEAVVKLTSLEILDKCIGLYDPDGSWDSYQGNVHLNTISRRWNTEEILEIIYETDEFSSITEFLESISSSYEARVRNRDPEEILTLETQNFDSS